jgi:hypothetical protein
VAGKPHRAGNSGKALQKWSHLPQRFFDAGRLLLCSACTASLPPLDSAATVLTAMLQLSQPSSLPAALLRLLATLVATLVAMLAASLTALLHTLLGMALLLALEPNQERPLTAPSAMPLKNDATFSFWMPSVTLCTQPSAEALKCASELQCWPSALTSPLLLSLLRMLLLLRLRAAAAAAAACSAASSASAAAH